ncbi:hypothetical protein LOCC1_G008204 [Lachnellula occidentalis]|uniref:BSD domain-containing protein n=1 Tax=Lachnellula occidentalis TaxID=215460 RepID=A0A8H8U5H1_9HELO|nr:hypothetical protein LOCC1_G008204 [Lachnellula occidentalis]
MPSLIPFSKSNELYGKLLISGSSLIRSQSPEKNTLPGHPRVTLDDAQLTTFLREELTTPNLDTFTPHLWKVATQSSSHITSLSSQIVRGRDITLSENPSLHLVWINTRIYIKPIPKYLLSHSFWSFYFTSKYSSMRHEDKILVESARGFLRSYAHLIRHKSDFVLAQRHGLVSQKIRYSQFIRFISCFEQLQDSDVSPRYSYGELRLSRLNFWAPIAIGKLDFHKSVWQYGDFFSRFYGPLLFFFGIFAIILNAMQVALVAQSMDSPSSRSWRMFIDVCNNFSLVTLFVVLFIVFYLSSSFVIRGLREVLFAFKALYRKRRAVVDAA